MKNKVSVVSFFDNLIKENYSDIEEYIKTINLDKKELSKFKAAKSKKTSLNQEEEESSLKDKGKPSKKQKEIKPNVDQKISSLASNLSGGDENSPGDEKEKTSSYGTVPPDFSEEVKKDYSKIIMSEANVFREIVSLFNRVRAGYSLEEEEASENFKKYFTRLTLSEREALYIFLKAFVIVLDPEIRDVYSQQEEEEEEIKKSSNIAMIPLPSEHGIKITSDKDRKASGSKIKDKSTEEVKKEDEVESPKVKEPVPQVKPVDKAPSPIIVGEGCQDKSEILSLLKEIG